MDYLESIKMNGITARIRRLNDKINSSGRKIYKHLDIDVDSNWHLILLLLEEKSTLSVTEIAKILDMSHPAVVKTTKKMTEKEYLVSRKDSRDSRKQILSLSKKAIEKLPELKMKWNVITSMYSEYFTDEFMKGLSQLEQHLTEKKMEHRIIEKQIEKKIDMSFIRINRLDSSEYHLAYKFLENIFTKEQNIPKELIPLKNMNQKWWCIRNVNEILGVVAAWKDKSEWHMGRLATDEKLRGLGLATKLMKKSVSELLQTETETIVIEARDIAVKIILNLGGKVTGETVYFYDMPITPMVIHKDDFIPET